MLTQTTIETTITDGMNSVERCIKRMFDCFFAFIALLFLSPLMAVIAILIRRQDGGPVFFRQERIGLGGKAFRILKFRTMTPEATEEAIPHLATSEDSRVTPVGHRLRDHHLDELPQLINVLCGDMSLVGPRPERQFYIDQIMERNSDYRYIYRMRPGCTSMATLYNGYTDTMEKMLIRLQMDLDYYRRRSLWLDAKIMFTTTQYLVFGKQF